MKAIKRAHERERERELLKRGNINSQMPGIFRTGRRVDRSLMSSLLAGWVPSYESHNRTGTHEHSLE